MNVMDRCGVDQAVLTQILNERDNTYLLECLHAHPERFAAVVGVDPTRSDIEEHLNVLASAGATGVRLRATDRSTGDDPLLVWRTAADLDLSVSCVGSVSDFTDPAFLGVIEAVPTLTIVLEHLASAARATRPGAESSDGKVFELARFSNVMVKIPGIGEMSARSLPVNDELFEDPIPSVLSDACAAFGPDRLMWGSDFPPVAAREGYQNALAFTQFAIEAIAPAGMTQIFGGTARRVFFR
jgi:L-fuconolactonase